MFGLRSKKPEAAEAVALAGPLDRLGRRNSAETRAGAQAASVGKEARLASVAAALQDAVAPRLREMVRAGAPAGEVTRQAGQLAQLHFRSNGVLLAPLELRGYVAEVLRPVLPATSFAEPAMPADAPPPAPIAPDEAVAVPTPDLSERLPQAAPAAVFAPQPRPAEVPKLEAARPEAARPEAAKPASKLSRSKVDQARRVVQPLVMSRIDLAAAVSLPRK
jgi:pilus assembly protein CpaF